MAGDAERTKGVTGTESAMTIREAPGPANAVPAPVPATSGEGRPAEETRTMNIESMRIESHRSFKAVEHVPATVRCQS